MNFGGFNPFTFGNMGANMSQDNIRAAADMLGKMSDDELRNYAKMMGMPNMSPDMIRQSINMMKGMDPNQFNKMKNMAGGMGNPFGGGFQPNYQNPQQQTKPKEDPKPKQSTSSTTESSRYAQIEKIKNKGNDYFKANKYDEASTSYLEAILEIEEIRSKNKNFKDSELDDLEVSCRSNYALVKLKLEDYHTVVDQSRKVLKIKDNGKAFYRLGEALHCLGKNEEALENLLKAQSLLSDPKIGELIEKVKGILKNKEKSKEDGSNKQREEEDKKKKEELKKAQEEEKRKKEKEEKAEKERMDKEMKEREEQEKKRQKEKEEEEKRKQKEKEDEEKRKQKEKEELEKKKQKQIEEEEQRIKKQQEAEAELKKKKQEEEILKQQSNKSEEIEQPKSTSSRPKRRTPREDDSSTSAHTTTSKSAEEKAPEFKIEEEEPKERVHQSNRTEQHTYQPSLNEEPKIKNKTVEVSKPNAIKEILGKYWQLIAGILLAYILLKLFK